MLKYIGRRLILLVISLFLIITITFSLMHAAPGSPFSNDRKLPDEVVQSLNEHYGLNKPFFVQYTNYLGQLARLDFGPSSKYIGRSVNSMLASGFPVSATLGLEAFFLALGAGVLLGVISALKHNKWQDYTCMVIAVIGISVPSFIMATVLQYVFAVKLHLLPIALWQGFSYTILPAVALSFGPLAFIARLTRSSMLDVLNSDYIRTAKAKGIKISKVITKHTLRNAILPVFTYLGPLLASVMMGSFIIEKIFAIPGIGQVLVDGITNRDYSMIMGVTIFYSVLLLVMVFLVDIISVFIDPRIKLSSDKVQEVS